MKDSGRARSVVVTGGAGFLGSHLCERLLGMGHAVACVDDLSTGLLENIEPFLGNPAFTFVNAEVPSTAADAAARAWRPAFVVHMASPASPVDFAPMSLRILRCGSHGTEWGLELAHRTGARFVLASTSEVYGVPAVHPQVESYWGNVNPIGIRSVYDEAKRYAEAMTMAYHRTHRTDVAIMRIFNTYGPRMRTDDGRLVPQLIGEALAGRAMTINGDGEQTRSLCYVDDLVDGIVRLMDSDVPGPVNLGNPEEHTVNEIAELIADLTHTSTGRAHTPARADDPGRRRPDITQARQLLGWRPSTPVRAGLELTVDWFRAHTGQVRVQARRDG